MIEGNENVPQASQEKTREQTKEELRAAAYAAIEEDEVGDTDAGEAKEAAPEVEPPQKAAEPEDSATEKQVDQGSLSRLMKKERELRELETNLKEQTKKYQEFEAQFKEFQAKQAEFERMKQFAAQDPVSFLRAAGVEDISHAARVLVAEDMGDQAPDDFRKLREKSQLSREFMELRKEIESLKAEREQEAQTRQQREQEAVRERFVSEYKSKLYSGVETAQFDLVRAMWDNDRKAAEGALFGAAQRLAQARLDAGIDEPPSNTEVYEALEKELSSYAKLLTRKGQGGAKALNSTMDEAPPSSDHPDALSREELRKRAYAEFFESVKK